MKNIQYRFSKIIKTKLKKPSPLEFLLELGKLKYAFAGGLPSPVAFEVDLLASISHKTIIEKPEKLQYGVTKGCSDLLKSIITLTKKEENNEIDKSNIITTIGSQHSLFMIANSFLDKHSKIILASPTYIGALEAFELFEPTYLCADIEEDGLNIDMVESHLKNNQDIKFIYVISEFQNPTGVSMSLVKRKRLIELSKKYGVPIIEDSPYRDTRYIGKQLPTIFSMYPEGTVFLKTLSKIAAPGFRVGWVIGDKQLIKALSIIKSASIMVSSTIAEATLSEYLNTKKSTKLVKNETIDHYREKRETMVKSLKTYMPTDVSWTEPDGGFVLWMTLPKKIDTEKLLKDFSAKHDVSFLPGKYFYPNNPEKNTLRLSFGVIDKDLIEEGVKRLAKSIKEYY